MPRYLKAHFSDYDFILAANLIDRLHHPRDFLVQIHERMNIGGILMLSSPYTWLEEHTARSEWLGGFQQDGNITTLAGISNILTQHFELVAEPQDVPFVIRETARKYQHTLVTSHDLENGFTKGKVIDLKKANHTIGFLSYPSLVAFSCKDSLS